MSVDYTLIREHQEVLGSDGGHVGRVDHVRGRIWEVRVALAGRVARVLFAMDDGEMVLLHGFIKKSRRTDAADIALALDRRKEWRHAEGE